jgi:hypothetical protein
MRCAQNCWVRFPVFRDVEEIEMVRETEIVREMEMVREMHARDGDIKRKIDIKR